MDKLPNCLWHDDASGANSAPDDSGATYTPGISERRGTKTTYLHSGLKNAFAQSDTSQQVAATREYDAFGNVTSSTGTWEGPFGYAGKFGYQSPSIPGVSTPDEGITLMGHRYYDPSTGRFLTRDPIFDGRNWYSYGGGEGNPLTQADPTGLLSLKTPQGLAAVAGVYTIGGGSAAMYTGAVAGGVLGAAALIWLIDMLFGGAGNAGTVSVATSATNPVKAGEKDEATAGTSPMFPPRPPRPVWPNGPAHASSLLGPPIVISDQPFTPGRDKLQWPWPSGGFITYEQHPYDWSPYSGVPWSPHHHGPHWHWGPGRRGRHTPGGLSGDFVHPSVPGPFSPLWPHR